MEKTLKILTAIAVALWLSCLVLGCLSSTGHIDWTVKTKENVECVDADADMQGI